MRGCYYWRSPVFPTHVGVFLNWYFSRLVIYRLPHARGGVSDLLICLPLLLQSSPRTWGCFHIIKIREKLASVFPTHVGVFLGFGFGFACFFRLPHARGGVSQFTRRLSGRNMSSPRTWGCFGSAVLLREPHGVFPTHVGVFPSSGLSGSRSICLPHARGGVSSNREQKYNMLASSPRTWGCF